MWVLQALCRDHEVDVVTRGGWDLDDLNRCAGTNIRREDLGRIFRPPLTPKVNAAGGALWHGLFLRYCRHLAPQYSLRISASRIIDWGAPGIHFLSDVTWNGHLQTRFDPGHTLSRGSILRRAYLALGQRLAGTSGREPAQHDILIANSHWTARVSSEYCKIPPVVIYPAVPGPTTRTSWSQREDSFLCLGRISPEKQIERAIAILDEVRKLGHSVRFHLVGAGDDPGYVEQIHRLCDARREWIVSHGALYGQDKLNLLSRCRFGINACNREAFGIATAEMMQAGIVPFVPREGGQLEIVQNELLIYENLRDAVSKIDAVLRSDIRQQELHEAMLQRSGEFQPESFCAALRDLVRRAIPATAARADKGDRSTSRFAQSV